MIISVVIGTHNQKEVLKNTLASLFHQTLCPELYEIQLIDSSSTDGTDKMVEGLKPTCRFNYQRVKNQGKAFARNFGVKNALGGIIFLTDADMLADKKILEEHLHAHNKKENACFEGLTINPDGKPYISVRLRSMQKLKWAYFLSGNLSAKKETLLKAGLFDEDFKGYGWEDIELGYRLSKMKAPLFYLPSAVNYHKHPVSDEGMLERKYHMGISAAVFYKKHHNFAIKIFLGMNPLSMAIYRFLKKRPDKLSSAAAKAKRSAFYRYIIEEYQYRLGLEDGLSKS